MPPAQTFALTRARVSPSRAFFGARPVTLWLRFRASGQLDLKVQIKAPGGRVMRRLRIRAARPPGPLTLRWNGLTTRGNVTPDGRYRVVVGAVGGRLHRAGAFTWHDHVYPVRGPHGFRGPVGNFGSPRNGGRTHEGFDINAACGTAVVAARAGTVRRRRYDSVLYGNYVIIRGARERREYWDAHLRSHARVREGGHVRTGQRFGEVGATGNARTIGCHLHFEIHGPGGPFDPAPRLRSWDRWS